jgi:hypothetical protein
VPAAGAPLDPELVLVDPELAHALTDDLDALVGLSTSDTSAQPADSVGLHPWNVRASSPTDESISDALRRITEFSELDPPKNRLRRFRRFAPVTAAWGAMVLVIGGLELGFTRLPL